MFSWSQDAAASMLAAACEIRLWDFATSMNKDWRGVAMQMGVPSWLIRRMAPDYLDLLLEAQMQGKLDDVTERQVRRVLLGLRTKRAVAPYLGIFRLGWEIISGKYWRAAAQVHSGPNTPSGTSTGTLGAPVAQFSYAPGANPVPPGQPAGTGAGVGLQAAPQAQNFIDAGIKAGEVRGYRCWNLHADGLLHSVMYDEFVWKPGEIAEGEPNKPYAGIYAFKSILLLHNYGSPGARSVTGTVDLWGDVYEHEHGYRAQYAAVASIDDSPYYDAKALRKCYGLTKRRKKK